MIVYLGMAFGGGDLASVDHADEAAPLADVLLFEGRDGDAAILKKLG
jgi:hypothetical protein